MADRPEGASLPSSKGDLGLRLISTAVLVPLALFAAWWGGVPGYLVAAAAGAIVFHEWLGITSVPARRFGAALAAIGIIAATLVAGLVDLMAGLAVGVTAAAIGGAIGRSGWLAAGALYGGALGIGLAGLRSDAAFGLQAVVILFVLVWSTDSLAYFTGRSLGGPKLWPAVSPKKTWSGFIGGLVGGVVLAALTVFLFGAAVTLPLVVVLTGLSLLSQGGDLFESALKRRFGVKDASGLIPGHGGLMDRVDGLIFAGAAAALLGWLRAGGDQIASGAFRW